MGQVAVRQLVQCGRQRFDDLALLCLGFALGLRCAAEDFDGLGHGADLVMAMAAALAGIKVATGHPGHDVRRFAQRGQGLAAQVVKAILDHAEDRGGNDAKQHDGDGQGRFDRGVDGLFLRGDILDQSIDSGAMFAKDGAQFGMGGVDAILLAAFHRWDEAVFHHLPEAVTILLHGFKVLAQGCVNVLPQPEIPAGFVFLPLPFKFPQVIRDIAVPVGDERHRQERFDDEQRRRQNIGRQSVHFLAVGMQRPAKADAVDAEGCDGDGDDQRGDDHQATDVALALQAVHWRSDPCWFPCCPWLAPLAARGRHGRADGCPINHRGQMRRCGADQGKRLFPVIHLLSIAQLGR